jgi:uncharacterized protein YbbC (DUF1343 family)/CubicO group peptidase (beta-lactamase class C family)
MNSTFKYGIACVLLVLAGCLPSSSRHRAATQLPQSSAGGRMPAVSAEAAFRTNKLAEIDAVIQEAIAAHKLPGGVLWIEHRGAIYKKAYGQRAVVPQAEPMTEDTIFDAASLTKVLAGTPAILLLVERGQVRLDDPVVRYIPEFGSHGKESITIRQLLTHTSGLRPDIGLKPDWEGSEACLRLCCEEKLQARPGEKVIYSDTGLILAGEIVRRVTSRSLDDFVRRELYEPLRMGDTGFNPPHAKLARIAPTEVEQGVPVRGVVHDPRARRMGGVAGHAGLFFTASDVARFARMMLRSGELEGVRVFRPETVRLMTSVQTPAQVEVRRGLGWDVDSPYSGPRGQWFPLGSYGHTGWTGTSLWIDPFSETFVIFLSNRNHPDERGSVVPLRARLGTLAAEAIKDFDFTQPVPGALAARSASPARTVAAVAVGAQGVRNGIDVLGRQGYAPLKGLRIGLITNHTGQDRQRRATIDLLREAEGVQLKVLFSPEHGIRGALDEKVSDSVDGVTGLPVFSLYGDRRAPEAGQLKDLDALVFDIQDIGCRFYTYISTMGHCMEAAGKAGIKFFVLDRVNPIGGVAVEGPVHAGAPTFVAYHALPVRHGMTVGELARMFRVERGWDVDLRVIPVEGWTRGAWFDATGQPWTNPSPNMRNLNEATLYPGVGLLESAMAVGRGTDTPFEVVGAPYVNDVEFAGAMNAAGLAGVRFVPVRFKPTASTFKDQACGGVFLVITDRERLNAVELGITLAWTLRRMYPEAFALDKMKPLLTDPGTLEGIRAGKPLAEIRAGWERDLGTFLQRREQALLYR